MSKQTAVEWVFEYLWENHNLSFSDNVLAKAKAMEKEQIIKAYTNGSPEFFDMAEEYYNETYSNNQNK